MPEAPHTRDAILDAAEAFLARRRFREMTVQSLMEPLPVTREAFYKHFTSRYQVLAALLDRFAAETAPSFELWVRGNDPARDLRALFERSTPIYQRRARIVRAAVDAASLDPGLEAAWEAFLQRHIEATAAQLRAHQDLGLATMSVDAHLSAAIIIHAIERLITQELTAENPPSREQVVDLLTRLVLGLAYPDLPAASVADG